MTYSKDELNKVILEILGAKQVVSLGPVRALEESAVKLFLDGSLDDNDLHVRMVKDALSDIREFGCFRYGNNTDGACKNDFGSMDVVLSDGSTLNVPLPNITSSPRALKEINDIGEVKALSMLGINSKFPSTILVLNQDSTSLKLDLKELFTIITTAKNNERLDVKKWWQLGYFVN